MDIPEVKRKSKDVLEGIQNVEYEMCFQQWKNRLNKVINMEGISKVNKSYKSKDKFYIFKLM